MFAQTIAGKVDTADLMFLIAFIAATAAVLIDVSRPNRDPATVLIRIAIALMALAFWIS
jgi:hypothetical protein